MFLKYNDLQQLPVVVLAFYTGFLLNAINKSMNVCDPEAPLVMLSWIRLECKLYMSNITGIAVFMLFKYIMTRGRAKIKNSIMDKRSSQLSDALSRHTWDSFIMQWSLNNFAVSISLLYFPGRFENASDPGQFVPLIINIIAGSFQVLSVLQLFGFSIIPIKRSITDSKGKIIFIKIRTYCQIIFSLTGMIVLPVIAFAWAQVQYKTSSIWFLWNIVCFANTIAVAVIVQKSSLLKLLDEAKNPDIFMDKMSLKPPTSHVIIECPTRNFKIGADIYSFSWVLCQKKKEFRSKSMMEKEIPSSYQAHQIYITMWFCAISQILISYLIWTEVDDKVIFQVGWDTSLIRFICISMLHFQFVNEYSLGTNCMKYLAMNNDKFKYPFRAFVSSNLHIISNLSVELLSINFIMTKTTIFDTVFLFVKLKIIANF